MLQQHHVISLAVAGQPTSPGKIAALADTKHAAQAVDGELRFRPIDEREPHRLPSRTKKAVAFFRMSRSWRRISFSRRSRFSSAVTSLAAADGSTARRSRLRPIQRTSLDSPIPRSPAISRCVRPLVCTRRTASSSNSFVNRCCCVIEFLIAHRELSTSPKQVQDTFYVGTLKGVGRIYQQTVIDTYSKLAFAKLYDRKTPLVAADLLNDRVIPFFDEHQIPLGRVLTDRGTEYCGAPERHEYELYLAVENIDHTRTKVKSPQTNGIVERFHRTVLNEFYRVAFRRKIYSSL